MGKETSKDLLRTLEDSGSGLDTVVHDFTEMANRRNLQIRCFFETRETQIANAVVKRSLAKLIQKIMVCSRSNLLFSFGFDHLTAISLCLNNRRVSTVTNALH